MNVSRRRFIAASCIGAASTAIHGRAAVSRGGAFAGEIGLTTGSFMQHLRLDPALHARLLLELPQRMRETLGLRVIDLMSETLPTMAPEYLDRLRAEAERHGCVLTNLKFNQRDANLADPSPEVRQHTLRAYRESVDAAHRLGCRWVRPALRGRRPDLKWLAGGLRELADYAGPKGITVLIENQSWMQSDPNALPAILAAAGPGLAAQPDISGFQDEVREPGLRAAFHAAASCDFKVFELGPAGEHARYDLRRFFTIGWESGFRGPWCIEHFSATVEGLWQGFVRIAALLRTWIDEQQKPNG